MTLEASRRERHAVRSQTELEGSLYGLRPSRDAAQPDAARGLGSLMGGGRVPSSSAGCSHQRVVICRVHRATVHGDGARALAAKATLVRGSHALAPSRATRHASPCRAAAPGAWSIDWDAAASELRRALWGDEGSTLMLDIPPTWPSSEVSLQLRLVAAPPSALERLSAWIAGTPAGCGEEHDDAPCATASVPAPLAALADVREHTFPLATSDGQPGSVSVTLLVYGRERAEPVVGVLGGWYDADPAVETPYSYVA